MRRTKIREFSFVEGVHQEVDSKILPDGYLSAAKNVRLRKDGRFGVRRDFDSIGNDTSTSADLVPRDLIGYGDGLCALGDAGGLSGDTVISDIADYTGNTPAEWSPSAIDLTSVGDRYRLSEVTNVRTLAAYSPGYVAPATSVTRIDCAAAGDVVCVCYSDNSSTTAFHFLRASTGQTLYETTLSGSRGRVVAVGTTFFLVAFTAGSGLVLSKYDPTTDAAASTLTAPIAAALNCFDVVPRRSGTGFWIVFNRTTPATSIVPYNSAGVAGSTITGPAVAYTQVTLTETANRVNLVTVRAGPVGELRSYTLAGALSVGPTSFTLVPDNSQPAAVDATFNGTEQVAIFYETSGSVRNEVFDTATHTTGGAGTPGASVFLGARPIVTGTPNYHGLFGIVANDGAFFSAALKSVIPSDVLAPKSVIGALINKFSGARVATDHIPSIARDASTGKLYWPTLVVDDQSVSRPRVTELDFLSSARRQTAQIAGLLYVGGGALGVYDTRQLYQAGFFLKPRIASATPSNGAGSLPSSVSLLTSITHEGRDALNNIVESDISDVSPVTMGGTDDTITLSVSSPIGVTVGDAIRVGYRSISGISQLRRAETSTTGTLTLLASDTTVRTHGVIYTQAGRAALGAILPNEAPPPADYVWKWGARLLTANANGAQVSKEIFPGEPVNWSGAVGFTIPSIPERIKGCAALDRRGFLFTAERIYGFDGDGPNDAGEGRYSEPVAIPGSTGLYDWRSLVETPLGLFFQGSNQQIWLLPRDGSAPVWIGQPVRDTLDAFPVVTSATLVTKEQLVCFTCGDADPPTSSRIVCYDLRAKTWIIDEFAFATPIASACSYQGRLAILASGVVRTERVSLTPSAFIEHGLTTGTINAFGSGWGKYPCFGLVGEFRGNCDLYARISYDDGKSFTELTKVHELRSTDYDVGETVDVEWVPARWKAQSMRLEFTARESEEGASEGFVFNNWWLGTLGESGPARKASANRG